MKQIAGKKHPGQMKPYIHFTFWKVFSNWQNYIYIAILLIAYIENYLLTPHLWYRLAFLEAKMMDVLGYLGPCKHTNPPGNWDGYLFVCLFVCKLFLRGGNM